MEAIKFRTNIKCSGCLTTVAPFLNEVAGLHNWEVDINDPLKVLTVVGESHENDIVEAVNKAGYKVEKV